MGGPQTSRGAIRLACLVAGTAGLSCSAPKDAVDVLVSPRARLATASVNGRGLQWVGRETGRPRRIRDVVHASLPAAPPSRLTFVADVPEAARLVLAAGIPGRYHLKPAVEFVVRVRQRREETTLLSRVVDPANRTADRRWIPLEADLSRHAGRGVEIILETRGFEATGEADRAFWGTPTITTAFDRSAPLVVLYLVDTLRADHLGLYGYRRDTDPHLRRFARDAVVFDAAIASSSWTKPSVASLFTSLLPGEHRCVQFYTPLDPALVTLAERMRDGGYATGAVVANRLVHARDGRFDQGFTYFATPPDPQGAAEAVDQALRFLDARRGLPTFLYVHTLDPHSPYAPPPPFDRRFGPAPTSRPAAEPYHYERPEDLARIVAQYDGEVAYGDREFGRFVEAVKARGLYDGATIVFLSDHGEEFLDHGGWVHGHTLFDELVRVPLAVKYPGNVHAGRRVRGQVQLVDVLPTILKSQGLAVPRPPVIAGRPLEESFESGGEDRPAVFETKYREYVAYGVRTPSAKYIRQLHPRPLELFIDLERDPRERLSRWQAANDQAPVLRRIAEAALTPAAFRYQLRVEGDEEYDLRIRTSGWIESVEASGLGPADRVVKDEGGQRVSLNLAPQPGRPREVAVLLRPHGVPLWLSGTRGGRRLRPSDIRMGAEAVAARAVPLAVPDVEDVHGFLSPPPAGVAGVALWITPTGSGEVPAFDAETRRRLGALGYLR